ncbi:transcription factor BHLH148-like isoform X2 [Wolffia australiana]
MKHTTRERHRRERLSQSYADVYRMIGPQRKTGKISIVREAAEHLRGLWRTRDALQRRSHELRAAAGRVDGGEPIRLRVGNPLSPVDSIIAVLERLKSLGVRTQSIRSCAQDCELTAAIDVQTELRTDEVQAALRRAVVEVEWKLRKRLNSQSFLYLS